jgi:ABC-type lipoprotein release transport system permease subunit
MFRDGCADRERAAFWRDGTMTSGAIGLVLGAIVGIVNYRLLQRLAERVEKPETKKVLGIVSYIDLLLMPTLGFLIGAYGFGS